MKQTVLQRLAAWIFGAWCFVLAGISLLEFFTRANATLSLRLCALLAALLAAGLCVLFACLLGRLKNAWAISGAVFALALAAQLIIALGFAPAPFSDYRLFYETAAKLYAGNTDFVRRDFYWGLWSYQFGFPWLLSLICRVFRCDTVHFCFAVNAVFSAGCSALVTALALRLGKPTRAALAGLVFTALPITLDLAAVLTNQQIGLFFILAALLVLSSEKIGWKQGLLAGVFLAVSKVARADIVVFLLAILAAAVLLLTKSTVRLRPEGQQKKVLAALLCVAVCFAGGWAVSKGLQMSGLQPYGLKNDFPLYKFAVGLNEESGGRYSEKITKQLILDPALLADRVQRDEAARQLIREELAVGPGRLLRLMAKKCAYLWTSHGYSFNVLYGLKQDDRLRIGPASISVCAADKLLCLYDALFRAALYAAAGWAAFRLARREKSSFVLLVCMLAVLALGAVSLLIEVQYRYAYLVMPVFCLLLPALPEWKFNRRREEK
jgi:hypothetical protein